MTDFFTFSNASTTVISAGSRLWDKGGGGGGRSPKKTFLAIRASVWSKNKGGTRAPWIYLKPKFRSEPSRMDHYRKYPWVFPTQTSEVLLQFFIIAACFLFLKITLEWCWKIISHHAENRALLILSTFTSLTTSVWFTKYPLKYVLLKGRNFTRM